MWFVQADGLPTECVAPSLRVCKPHFLRPSLPLVDPQAGRGSKGRRGGPCRPYPFKLVYTVTLQENRLLTQYVVNNTGTEPFDFTAALHTYIEVDGIAKAKVRGLQGLEYLDKVRPSFCSGPPPSFGVGRLLKGKKEKREDRLREKRCAGVGREGKVMMRIGGVKDLKHLGLKQIGLLNSWVGYASELDNVACLMERLGFV